MLVHFLMTQYELKSLALHRNVEGITENEALVKSNGGGNCMNWIMGHVVASRQDVLRRLGKTPVWDDGTTRNYRRGSYGTSGKAPVQLADLLDLFDQSQLQMIEGSRKLAAESWEDRLDGGTRADHLTRLLFHESYHIGQVGLLRRMLGHRGAIQ